MNRRLLHSLAPAAMNRPEITESDLTPAVAGMVSLMVAILAMIWLFMSSEIQPDGKSIQQPAETDLMVIHHKWTIAAGSADPNIRFGIWGGENSANYPMM